MTFDLGVWNSRAPAGGADASRIYADLCRGVAPENLAEGGSALDAFLGELTATWPEVRSTGRGSAVKPDSPWAAPFGLSSRSVLLSSHWEHAELVLALVTALAARHGLTVFDPQSEEVYPPEAQT